MGQRAVLVDPHQLVVVRQGDELGSASAFRLQ
jgi:hypothetical protein